MRTPSFPLIPFALAVIGLAFAPSCIPSGLTDDSGSGSLGAGAGGSGSGSGGHGNQYNDNMLAGDWTGVLIPVPNPLVNAGEELFLSRNFYFRANSGGEIIMAADGLGLEFDSLSSVIRTSSVGPDGGFTATLQNPSGRRETLTIAGKLNETLTAVSGFYELRAHTEDVPLGEQELIDTGNLRLKYRDQSNSATVADFAGVWSGVGYDIDSRFLSTIATFNSVGGITDGGIYNGGSLVRSFSLDGSNDGVLSLASASTLGRLDNVLMEMSNGHTLYMDYILIDIDEGVISGPLIDSVRPTTELVLRMLRQ